MILIGNNIYLYTTRLTVPVLFPQKHKMFPLFSRLFPLTIPYKRVFYTYEILTVPDVPDVPVQKYTMCCTQNAHRGAVGLLDTVIFELLKRTVR
jgi:hypothetical protein